MFAAEKFGTACLTHIYALTLFVGVLAREWCFSSCPTEYIEREIIYSLFELIFVDGMWILAHAFPFTYRLAQRLGKARRYSRDSRTHVGFSPSTSGDIPQRSRILVLAEFL